MGERLLHFQLNRKSVLVSKDDLVVEAGHVLRLDRDQESLSDKEETPIRIEWDETCANTKSSMIVRPVLARLSRNYVHLSTLLRDESSQQNQNDG